MPNKPVRARPLHDRVLVKRLDAEEERIGGIIAEIELVQRAAEVLGAERVDAWIQKSIPSLGGRTPYSLLDSEEGRKQVAAVLGRIEHGVY